MNFSKIKSDVRASLRGNWGTGVLIILVYMLLSTLAEGFGYIAGDTFSILGTIAFIIIYGPLQYGVSYAFLKINRGGKSDVGDMFAGFDKSIGNNISAGLSIYIYTFLWSLLLIIPGIVASYSYSMTYFIMIDNPGLSSSEAIKKSKQLMKGHKLELFCLDLTFIGWMILSIFTLGIGMLWVSAYMTTAHAKFYEVISGSTGTPENESKETDQDPIVMPVAEVDKFNEDNSADVVYTLKCTNCGASETHTKKTATCPYCGEKMIEHK